MPDIVDPVPPMRDKKSFGERMVRLDFNPSEDSKVTAIKRCAADLIDMCHRIRVEENNTATLGTAPNPEIGRCASIAITHIETAAMYAVKAATVRK